jgi:hypothetical protein
MFMWVKVFMQNEKKSRAIGFFCCDRRLNRLYRNYDNSNTGDSNDHHERS